MKDRRTARRYDMSLPIIVHGPEAASRTGKTHDLSTHGVYFTIDDDLKAGAQLNLTMVLPAAVTGGSEVFVEAVGKILRVDKNSSGEDQPIGVAVVIERYVIVRNQTSKL